MTSPNIRREKLHTEEAVEIHLVDQLVSNQGWRERPYAAFDRANAIDPEMAAEFVAGVRADIGKKYVKIVREGSVHSFVMMEDDSKFRRGDILRAASWAAPARNSARGNVLAGDLSRVSWTGVI